MKKFLKAFLLTFLLVSVFVLAFSQVDSTGTATGGASWFSKNYVIILSAILGIYELLARLIPTISNISIISLIMKVIAFLIPNNKKISPDPNKRTIKANNTHSTLFGPKPTHEEFS